MLYLSIVFLITGRLLNKHMNFEMDEHLEEMLKYTKFQSAMINTARTSAS